MFYIYRGKPKTGRCSKFINFTFLKRLFGPQNAIVWDVRLYKAQHFKKIDLFK